MEKIRNEIYVKNPCNQKCPSLLASGEGRWNEGTWKPFYNGMGRVWFTNITKKIGGVSGQNNT